MVDRLRSPVVTERHSLRPAAISVAFYALVALAGLRVASWEPHVWADSVLRDLAYVILGACALWVAMVSATFLWLARRRR